MRKPRVIAADPEEADIRILLSGLCEAFYGKIDLEIITDEEYFAEMFREPQTADVLLVSEELYTDALKKHNIGKLFLLTKYPEETQVPGTVRVYKYAGLREITEMLIGACPILGEEKTERKTVTLAVTSASGGTGKTTVALGIAQCLSKKRKEVLYVAADGLQAFRVLLREDSVLAGNDVYEALMVQNDIYKAVKRYIRKEGISFFPPLKNPPASAGIKNDVFVRIAEDAAKSKEFDYVVIDTDHAFDEKKLKCLAESDAVVFVINQTKTSAVLLEEMISHLDIRGMRNILTICNDHRRSEGKDNTDTFGSLSIDGFVGHAENYNSLHFEDFAKVPGIEQVSYLLM